MHDRLVRRIMKREGDGSFAILLGALSCIYADEGYYVCADELFYEDLSACLYEKTAADVKRILALAVEYGGNDGADPKNHDDALDKVVDGGGHIPPGNDIHAGEHRHHNDAQGVVDVKAMPNRRLRPLYRLAV